MNKSIDQLILTLEKEYELYKDILEIAKKKRRLIIDGSVKELDTFTKREQDLIITLGKFEKVRESVVSNLVKELSINNADSITELSEYLDKPSNKRVLDIKEKLSEILSQVKKENDLNSKLIKQSLDYIEFNQNLIFSIDNKGSTYSSKAGEDKGKSKRNLFDARV